MTNEQVLNLQLQAVSEKLRREMKKHLFWSRFIAMGSGAPDPFNDPKPGTMGNPITVIDEIKRNRLGNHARIPMQLELSGPATYGSAAMVGREENLRKKWAEVYVNTVRHGVVVEEGSMETFNERAFNAAIDAVDMEAYWHAHMENWQVETSIYEGISENISTAVNDPVYGQGRGFAKRYHPNLYYWSGATDAAAVLTKVGAALKFPTATEVFNAANLSSNQKSFSSYTVEAARTVALKRGLRPFVADGSLKFFPWVISTEQASSLRNDARFQAVMNSPQWKDIKDHPFVKGSIGYYLGFVFFEDTEGTLVRGYSGSSGSDLNILGSVEMIWDTESQNPRFLPQQGYIANGGLSNQVSTIFGDGFLGKGLGTDPVFRYREEDYGEWKGLACRAIYGYGRMDYVPDNQIGILASNPTGITGVYNRSSMQIMTYEKVMNV